MNEKEQNLDRQTYNTVISLGFFCSVAQELERIGLRDASYPFDWLISDFIGVITSIDNHFKDFLKYDYLAQMRVNPRYYINTKYGFQFYHDFNPYQPLKKQIRKVRKKYKRRIKRFYKSISYPTLFVRYIENVDELKWIEANYNSIVQLIKSFNPHNSIVFISNDELKSDKLRHYTVKKDENDTVARKPFTKNEELNKFFQNLPYCKKEQSKILQYRKLIIRKLRVIKARLFSNGKEKPTYIHDVQYPKK